MEPWFTQNLWKWYNSNIIKLERDHEVLRYKIRPKWALRLLGRTSLTKTEQMHQNRSFMLSICSHILQELIARRDTQKVKYMTDILGRYNVPKLMSFTQWACLWFATAEHTLWIREWPGRIYSRKHCQLQTSNQCAWFLRLGPWSQHNRSKLLQMDAGIFTKLTKRSAYKRKCQ